MFLCVTHNSILLVLDDDSAVSEVSLCTDGVGCGTTTDDKGLHRERRGNLELGVKRLLVKITVKRIMMVMDKMIKGRKEKAKQGRV